MIFQGGITRKGLPAFWERREDGTLTTSVQLIADGDFRPKKAIFLNKLEAIPKSDHAIFVCKEGDTICRVFRDNDACKVTVGVYLVTNIEDAGKRFMIHTRELFRCGYDDVNAQLEKYTQACADFVDAALNKLDSNKITSFYSQPLDETEFVAKMNKK